MTSVAFSDLYSRRREVHAAYPSVFRLAVVRRAARLARAHLSVGARLLDVGAGRAGRGERLVADFPGAVVVTVDPDPGAGARHRRVEEVEGPFDVALALEVIEHLPLAGGIDLLWMIRERLKEGGAIVVSTPNVYCPGRFLRDATHVTPYAWDELGGALLLAGYELTGLYRVVPGSFLRRVGRGILAPLGRALGVDHAPSIAAVGRRPSPAAK